MLCRIIDHPSNVVGGSTKEVGGQNMGEMVGGNQKWSGGKKW